MNIIVSIAISKPLKSLASLGEVILALRNQLMYPVDSVLNFIELMSALIDSDPGADPCTDSSVPHESAFPADDETKGDTIGQSLQGL